MGSGKSTVGPVLAELLRLPFVDLDRMIVETAGCEIHEIIAVRGEEEFRRIESDLLREASEGAAVIATGGGVVLRAENRELMRSRGMPIWLDAPFDVCWQRISDDSTIRPLAPDRATALERFRQRRALYAESRLRVETGMKTAEEIAREILSNIAE